LSFVLNSGEKQDVDGGGGTYGYGKGAFFLASKVGTILIYSRFRENDQIRARLIGSSLLSSGTVDGVPYTGRHWWGLPDEGHCEPLVDADAISVAKRLGLPDFRAEETGTTVVVLDPDLADPAVPEDDLTEMTMGQAGRFVADAAAWNLWPLMIQGRSARLNVSVTAHGAPIEVPSEYTDAVLASFVGAYRAMSSSEPNVWCGNPRKALGRFAYLDTFGAKVESTAGAELGLSGSPHHICCMRRPDLVVRYLEQPPKAHPDVGYAGVFKVEDELDNTFAKAEPPTHDDWVDAQLSGREATFVRVSRRRLNEETAKIVGPKAKQVRVTEVPAGPVAQRLGFLLSGVGGTGAAETVPAASAKGGSDGNVGSAGGYGGDKGTAGTDDGGGGTRSGGGRPRHRPVLVGQPYFRSRGGRVVLAQRVQVYAHTTVRGRAEVITGDGGPETARPAGSEIPTVVGWRCNGVFSPGDTFDVGDESVEVDVLVSAVEDAAIDIAVEVVT
jgi:hypothetical protein